VKSGENPPGAAMVYDGKIVATGIEYGNAVVCVQPKRGCAGSRCDGQVCKILHDPEVPPPHQYLAVYQYLEIAEYKKVKSSDKARTHILEHIIIDLLRKTKLSEEIRLDKRLEEGYSRDTIIELAHEVITRIYNTQIPDGMHIFGEVPEAEKKIELINSILKHDSELSKLVFALMGQDIGPSDAKSDFLAAVDNIAKAFIYAFLTAEEPLEAATRILGDKLKINDKHKLSTMRDRVMDISARIEASDEMGSLFHGFDAGYIEPGPSGLITRGKPEILPTGRNFYSLDPFKWHRTSCGLMASSLHR
jgi:cobaltochelatase CobN